MDRFDAMAVVLAVAEAGSLSAGARRLKAPLATVSRKVSELEAHLGTKLFNRSSRRLVPTEAGSAYVAACKRILDDVGEAERTASGEYRAPTGELILTAPVALGRLDVIPILAEFLVAYPDIDVQLVLNDRVISLPEDQVDVGLRIGMLPDSSLVAQRVGTVRRVACASPAYLAAHGTPRAPSALAEHACISYQGFLAPDLWHFVRGGAEISARVRSRLRVNSAEAAIDAACAGIGITLVYSYHAAAALADGTLVSVLDEFQPPALPVSLVYGSARFLPVKLRAFLDFAAPRLRARLAA